MHKTLAQNQIIVTVTNLRNDDGYVMLSLFNNNQGWPEKENDTLKRIKLPIENGNASIVFNNMPSGFYSVAIMHDENNNLEMDKTVLGLPKEGYGFSNDVMGIFGPPAFKEAAFKHTQNTAIRIKIRY